MINQKVLQYVLKAQGVSYEMVADGAAAVKAFEEHHFDFILMDLNLPIKNGKQATKEIRQLEKELGRSPCVIIAMTANVTQDKQSCLQAGLDEYISKPFVPSSLIELLENMLRCHASFPEI